MVRETILFDIANRWVPYRQAIDDLCYKCGDPPYGQDIFDFYFADYCGIMRQEKPKRFFEIGVRYGATAIAMLLARNSMQGAPKAEFLGIDDESYHNNSCAVANSNFEKFVPWANAKCIKWNSITQGLPPDIGAYDLCHIDGNKEYNGRMSDLLLCWPILNKGGLIILDDARKTCYDGSAGPTYAAAMDFLAQFENSNENVEWQYNDYNLQHHLYLRKEQ